MSFLRVFTTFCSKGLFDLSSQLLGSILGSSGWFQGTSWDPFSCPKMMSPFPPQFCTHICPSSLPIPQVAPFAQRPPIPAKKVPKRPSEPPKHRCIGTPTPFNSLTWDRLLAHHHPARKRSPQGNLLAGNLLAFLQIRLRARFPQGARRVSRSAGSITTEVARQLRH